METGRPEGPKLRGITKLLSNRVYSAAPLPSVSTWRGGAWAGAEGGLRRGRAVDSQVSRLANLGVLARRGARMLKLTRLAFDALAQHNLVPVGSQRVVIDKARRLGTAIDVVCTRGAHELVIVELKCGFSGSRALGSGAMFQPPFRKAKDCALHRHFAQLSATLHLFEREEATLAKLATKGVDTVSAVLLYVDNAASEKFELPMWWRKRGGPLLGRISSAG
tara:strand:+ start:252 stop:914 length:663 start_codon:yes stop_codon:yes gene_type:complete